MALNIKEVEHVALLARLSLSEEEKRIFAEQLGAILEYADKLKELDTDGIVPLEHILPVYNVFREDEVEPGPAREEMLSSAPLVEEALYRVPRIM